MIDDLTELGLTDGEARVFLSLVRLGPATAGSIVKESRVSYSKIYDVLDRLAGKGLVGSVNDGDVKHFSAVEPGRLIDYIRKKEDEVARQREAAGRIVPKLKAMASSEGRRGSEIFTGLRGLRSAYEQLLEGAQRGDVLRYLYPFDGYHETATPFYSKLYMFQKEKEIEERGIATARFRGSEHYKNVPKEANMRFVGFPLPGTMDIFRDKVLVIAWEEKTGLLISSKEIAGHYRSYFDSIWETAER
ncbi:MAG: helix-turn-helix domain-containing protein [Candidatus Micrarchaeia archaeon]